MPQVYDKTDFIWGSRGDIVLNAGDVMDTYADPLRSLYQEVRTRVMSALNDWKNYPDLGATLSDFVGEPNNKATAENVKIRVITSITRNGLVKNSDIKVRYAPIDVDKLMVRITISVSPTSRNAGSEYLTINILYDYSENHAYFIQ